VIFGSFIDRGVEGFQFIARFVEFSKIKRKICTLYLLAWFLQNKMDDLIKEYPMKKKIRIALTASIILALASCNTQGELLEPEATAKNLVPMRSLLSGMESMLALAVESDTSVDFARTIDPTAGEGNNSVSAIMRTDAGAPKTPEQVYNSRTGTGEKRFPEIGYMENLWTKDTQAYFYISPEDGNKYRIKLYTFPRLDFSVKYDYEEYLVEANDGTWAYSNDKGEAYHLSTYKTYLSDGTVVDREIKWSNGMEDWSKGFAPFSTGADILGANFSQYDYPATITFPDNTIGADWSSHTVSRIGKNGATVEEFYTEKDSLYSGVMYSAGKRWSADKLTVTRYSGNLTEGSLISRSLSTTGNSWGFWETERNVIEKGVNADSKTTYSSAYDVWWSGPAQAAAKTSSYRQELSLVETGVDTHNYSGTITEYWGPLGGTFNIGLTNNNDGTYTLQYSGWSVASRNAMGSDLSIVVDQRDNLSFSLKIGVGTFNGNFVQGALIGTYSEGGSSLEVTIDSSGITAGGTNYKYSELAE